MGEKRKGSATQGSPGVSRRRLLQAGTSCIAVGAFHSSEARGDVSAHIPPWTRKLGPGVDAAPYGTPSTFESEVIRRHIDWLTPTVESSVNFTPIHALEGIVTPNGICFERHHGGVAMVDPDAHRLIIHGMVDRPLEFTMADLLRLPRMSKFYFLECAANSGMEWRNAQMNSLQFTHGMIHCVQYTGVPLKLLLEEAGYADKAKWLLVEGGDAAAMTRSVPMAKALDDCMVALFMNGERLRPEQGYPLRLVVPGFEGSMWIKWLRRIEVGEGAWQTREETARYTDLMPDGRARRFTWEMDCKSVITSPCPENPIHNRGANVISGLAWSGRGKVARVDVSLDGGRNWRTARLDGPVDSMCLTRFYLDDWEWHGEELYLQSRAIDETGYVQPQMTELKSIRGDNSVYHNNAIQTWHVRKSGEVENVRLG